MLDIGWSEMFMIAVVAIVVIGPKELPRTLRTIGQWIGKARAMTRDFQNSVSDMIAETELDELRNSANSISDFDSNNMLDDMSSSNMNTSTPPPTPQKWPPDDNPADDPDDDIDASDEEMAQYQADMVAEDQDSSSTSEPKAKVTDS